MDENAKKPVPPVRPSEAPIDESPLAKPTKTKKDLEIEKRKSKTQRNDDWKI